MKKKNKKGMTEPGKIIIIGLVILVIIYAIYRLFFI